MVSVAPISSNIACKGAMSMVLNRSLFKSCFRKYYHRSSLSLMMSSSTGIDGKGFERTAGIIIVGDEILKGHTKDLNSSFLLSRLWTNGVSVKKVSFVPDDVDVIANEVRTFSSKYSLIITCGGIGPTHDDMTFEAVSKAFDEPLALNEELKEKIKLLTSSETLSSGFLKMATLPKSTKLITGHDPLTNTAVKYPLMNIKNVYIFPGVPEFMQKSFAINQHLFSAENQFYLMKIYISVDENSIAANLENVDSAFPDVSVGSYPMLSLIHI